MASQNKTGIIIGIVLIVAAFACVVGVFYFLGQTGREKDAKIARLEAQMVNLISEKSQGTLPEGDADKTRRAPVSMKDLLVKAERLYGPEEQARREGVLWIDREAQRAIITLGGIQGLEPGSRLEVYRNENLVGEVTVDTPLDVIAYVTPVERTLDAFPYNYYRVVIKNP